MGSISDNDGVVRSEVKLLFECSNMSEKLPPELLTKIFFFLPYTDLKSVLLVCR